jgi:hypothetical protein
VHQPPLAKTTTSGFVNRKVIAKLIINFVGLYNNTFNDASDHLTASVFLCLFLPKVDKAFHTMSKSQ